MLAKQAHSCAHERIDLVSNAIAVVPRPGAGAAAAAGIAMRQGTFETVAESSLLEKSMPGGKNQSAIVDLAAARKALGFNLATAADAAGLSDLDRAIAS